MADRNSVERIVVARFQDAFGKPRRDPEQLRGLIREYCRIFEAVPTNKLARIVDDIIDRHEDPGWPRIARCRQAITRHMGTPTRTDTADAARTVEISTRAILETEIGQTALKEGWAQSLVIHCRSYAHDLPKPEMVGELRAGHKRAVATHKALCDKIAARKDVKPTALETMLLRIWETMGTRETALKAAYLRRKEARS